MNSHFDVSHAELEGKYTVFLCSAPPPLYPTYLSTLTLPYSTLEVPSIDFSFPSFPLSLSLLYHMLILLSTLYLSISCPPLPSLFSSMSLLLSAAASLDGTRPSIIPILVIFFARILLISHMDLINLVRFFSIVFFQFFSFFRKCIRGRRSATYTQNNGWSLV